MDEQMFILLAQAGFRVVQRGSEGRTIITAVLDSRNFSVDSRNENLPNKHIHQNYVWIAVPVRPFLRRGIGAE